MITMLKITSKIFLSLTYLRQKISAFLYIIYEKYIFTGRGSSILISTNSEKYTNCIIETSNNLCDAMFLEEGIHLDEDEKKTENGGWKGRSSYKVILNVCNVTQKSMSILDVGCHVGYLANMLNELNLLSRLKYTGTDISARFIKRANQ